MRNRWALAILPLVALPAAVANVARHPQMLTELWRSGQSEIELAVAFLAGTVVVAGVAAGVVAWRREARRTRGLVGSIER